MASTRSLSEALPALIGGTSVVFAGLFVWIGSRQPLPSFVFWCVHLWLAFFLLFVFLGAMRLGGRIEITIQGGQGTVFTGVGDLGRTQHFDWTDAVEIQDQHITSRGVDYHEIVLHAAKKIRTGKFLTKDQSSEILQTLRQLQRTKQPGDRS